MVAMVADSERPAPKARLSVVGGGAAVVHNLTAVEREFVSPGFFRDMAEILWEVHVWEAERNQASVSGDDEARLHLAEVVTGPMPTSGGEVVCLPLVEGDRYLRVDQKAFDEEVALQRHLFTPWSKRRRPNGMVVLSEVPLWLRQQVAADLLDRGRGWDRERDTRPEEGEVFLPMYDQEKTYIGPDYVVIPAVRRAWLAWQEEQAKAAAAEAEAQAIRVEARRRQLANRAARRSPNKGGGKNSGGEPDNSRRKKR